MAPITIYHNPDCGTSRDVLALIRGSGAEPRVVEYLKTPPDRATFVGLLAALGCGPRGLLRRKGTPYDELGLDDPAWSDDALIELMLARPILIERPIVVAPRGTLLCRPSHRVLELLASPHGGASRAECGGLPVDDGVRRPGG